MIGAVRLDAEAAAIPKDTAPRTLAGVGPCRDRISAHRPDNRADLSLNVLRASDLAGRDEIDAPISPAPKIRECPVSISRMPF